MTTALATLENAYLARGLKMTLDPAENPAYVLATLMVACGYRPDPIKICALAAWYDEPVAWPQPEARFTFGFEGVREDG